MSSSPPAISAALWLLERHFPWQPQSHLLANTSDCLSFAQDGSNETDKFDVERTSCDAGRAPALETTRHKPTQCSRATRHHRIWLFLLNTVGISTTNWAPPVFIIQPLTSATQVRSVGGWYNRILLYSHLYRVLPSLLGQTSRTIPDTWFTNFGQGYNFCNL